MSQNKAEVTALALNVRAEPMGQIIDSLPKGYVVTLKEPFKANQWAEITEPYYGFVFSRYLKPLEDAAYGPFAFECWPTLSRVITQAYGVNKSYYKRFGLDGHEGIDFRAGHGDPIFAVADGVVKTVILERESKNNGGHNYGVHVRISHTQGYESIYAHLHCTSLEPGQQVKAKQIIGLADNTGNSFGNHLHLTLKKDGRIVDPTPFLQGVKNVNIS